MAVEYEIASDIAVISEVADTNQLAHVVKFYTGAVTYDDEASSKYATVTIDGKSQRVMLCIAVNGTVNYDDVPCKYSTVDGHRCLNIVEPNGTETADDVPSVYETMVVDGKTVRAIRCVLINETPIYDGASNTCTFVDSGKTHTAQLVNVVGAGSIEVIVKGVPPLVLPDAIHANIPSLIAYGDTEQRSTPSQYQQVNYVTNTSSTVLNTGIVFNFAKNYQLEIRCRAVGGSFYMIQSRKTQTGDTNVINGLSGSGSTLGINGNFNGTTITSGITRTAGNILYIKMTAINGVLTLYIRDETANTEDTVTGTYTVENVDALSWIGLWGNEVASNRVDVNADVYMAKIIEDGVTVLDYVPCLNVATAGFYDKVSGTFKTTTGLSAALNPVLSPDNPIDIWCNNGVIKVRHQSGLPLGYQAVEYLTAQNLIGLGTGVRTTQDTELEGKFERTKNNAQYMWQSDSGSALSTNTTSYVSHTSANWRFGNQTASISTSSDITIAIQNKDGVWFNGEKVGSYTDVPNFTSSNYLKAFGLATTEPLRIYYIKMRNYGETTDRYHWIPCRRLFDNALGFYELINGTFHTNSATTINAGPDLNDPAEIYIDGTQETIAIKDDNNTTVSTAVAQNLFAIDDYIDQQDIVTGNVTRKIGIKVFDGTENWVKAAATTGSNTFYISRFDGNTGIANMICTHASVYTDAAWVIQLVNQCTMRGSSFLFSNMDCADATEFKNWLAAQYAAGTPVIVLYPLDASTTEHVTAQHMSTAEGDNTAEITQASINGLELQVTYQAGVSVTIEEVEDAQLSNDVEVTIQ